MRGTVKLISSSHPSLNLSHPTPDCFVWNTLIRARGASAAAAAALLVYIRMRRHGVCPDLYTFPFLLQSFSTSSHLPSGRRLHGHLLLSGFISDAFVQNSLINMYSTCGDLEQAQKLFGEVPCPDIPTWNSIVKAHLRRGAIEAAVQLFEEMPERNVVSWTCMIDGLTKCGDDRRALELFREMQGTCGAAPNEFTMSAVLSACGRLGALEQGKWAHAFIRRRGMRVDAVLGTCLIDMYAKCGSIERASQVFDDMDARDRDVPAWSAMISGLALHGRTRESLALFDQMVARRVTPNGVTFLGVLCACAHAGRVEQGAAIFSRMSAEFDIVPSIQHYGCMVDLYARAGLVRRALELVETMPMEPDVLIWGALLSGSSLHGAVGTCEFALTKLIALEPLNSGAYVLLSNLYAKLGKWPVARQVRGLMEARGVRKPPGCSLVELGGTIFEFSAGDDTHPESDQIRQMLGEMMRRLREAGYVANTAEALLDLDEEGRAAALALHSEKLALAFCFLKTQPGTPLRVVKNLRMCADCHAAFKLVAELYEREIVVRDCSRFHHFSRGLCSCGDYW